MIGKQSVGVSLCVSREFVYPPIPVVMSLFVCGSYRTLRRASVKRIDRPHGDAVRQSPDPEIVFDRDPTRCSSPANSLGIGIGRTGINTRDPRLRLRSRQLLLLLLAVGRDGAISTKETNRRAPSA